MQTIRVSQIQATNCRILVISDEKTIKEDLCISHALQVTDGGGASSAPERYASTPAWNTRPAPPLDITSAGNEREAMGLLATALQDRRPFDLVIFDGRLLHGKDYRRIIKGLWQIQANLRVVLHAVSQMNAFEQIPIELGAPHQLLVFKFRLVPFEISQLIRTLTAKHRAEPPPSDHDHSLKAQILEASKRFADVSNQLRQEQDHRKQLEEQLCRAQRLGTVGRFADSMAHFVSNYLTVIQGLLGVARVAEKDAASVVLPLDELWVATKHAADITSQFVAFNRREYLHPKPAHLGQIIDSQAALLQKVLGETIVMQIKHKPDLPMVMADPGCLEQTIFSLLIHARESMPQGGWLMIQTRQLHIPDVNSASQVHADARPGDYAVMIISDTGKGMTPDELSRLFDASQPSQEEGGDISLILVQGLMRLQGGWINVKSVPKVGTEFSVFLPVVCDAGQAPRIPEKNLLEPTAETKTSTVLIVDDDESVRQTMEFVLKSQGYTVLTANTADEALDLWRSHASVIKLVITDIMMPGGTSGFDLEKSITETDPTVPVIFTCGYCSGKLPNAKELKAGDNFLSKPFGMVELLNIVGHAMARPAKA